VTNRDFASSSKLIAPTPGWAQSRSLIHVSWDAGPDLEEFLRFIRAYAKGRFSGSVAERLVLSSNELLDNAVRYGSVAREFSYGLAIDSAHVAVWVRNTTVSTRLDMLKAQLRRLAEGPSRVYASELQRSTSNAGVRHEAEMEIELTLDDLDVTVLAHCPR
jgi:hypothetical protein